MSASMLLHYSFYLNNIANKNRKVDFLSPPRFIYIFAWSSGFQDTMMQTSPPTKKRFNNIVNQWVIYDKYMAYEHAKEVAEEHESKMESGMGNMKSVRKRLTQPEPEDPKELMLSKMMRCARILERMVNQNNHFDIAQG